ncbi:lytic transglycosylase domain-containing protein [Candidatus Berkelbacteria bacterium]|nr:lytic transglycosylase domain-containing protein [Candidatus Berkelbacteria bacterium]
MDMSSQQPETLPQRRTYFRLGIALVVIVVIGLAVTLLPRIFAELRYPLDYEELIVKEGTEHDLDPFLVAAVVYAESRFHPEATSPVGARGLMQLMPQTAAGIAARMGESDYTQSTLYDPETNLRFGTFHLQGLMGRYNSNEAAALVGYNGGGTAGDRYLAGDRASVPRESLRYVEKVQAAKAAYQELYPVRLSTNRDVEQFFEPAAPEPLVNILLRAVQTAVVNRINQ